MSILAVTLSIFVNHKHYMSNRCVDLTGLSYTKYTWYTLYIKKTIGTLWVIFSQPLRFSLLNVLVSTQNVLFYSEHIVYKNQSFHLDH